MHEFNQPDIASKLPQVRKPACNAGGRRLFNSSSNSENRSEKALSAHSGFGIRFGSLLIEDAMKSVIFPVPVIKARITSASEEVATVHTPHRGYPPGPRREYADCVDAGRQSRGSAGLPMERFYCKTGPLFAAARALRAHALRTYHLGILARYPARFPLRTISRWIPAQSSRPMPSGSAKHFNPAWTTCAGCASEW